MGELSGVDRYGGVVRVGLLAVARNRLGGLGIHRISSVCVGLGVGARC